MPVAHCSKDFALNQNACRWLERDDTGRPRCEHGWAHSQGGGNWRCPFKAYENLRRYRQTEKGRATLRRSNSSDSTRGSKALYELTRVRVS